MASLKGLQAGNLSSIAPENVLLGEYHTFDEESFEVVIEPTKAKNLKHKIEIFLKF